jgi:hypothetical protein
VSDFAGDRRTCKLWQAFEVNEMTETPYVAEHDRPQQKISAADATKISVKTWSNQILGQT